MGGLDEITSATLQPIAHALPLSPDYGFFSWPEPGVGSFLEVQDKTRLYEADLTWSQKIPKLFWRGAMMVDIRKELWEIAKDYKWGESVLLLMASDEKGGVEGKGRAKEDEEKGATPSFVGDRAPLYRSRGLPSDVPYLFLRRKEAHGGGEGGGPLDAC